MTQKIKLIDKDNVSVIINIFSMFKKIKYEHAKGRHGGNKKRPKLEL